MDLKKVSFKRTLMDDITSPEKERDIGSDTKKI